MTRKKESVAVRVGELTIRVFMDGIVPPDVQEWQGPPRPLTEAEKAGEELALDALAAVLLDLAEIRRARKRENPDA